MGRKKKFKPIITRIKLNPEQAVLSCCENTLRGRVRTTQQCSVAGPSCPGTISTASS